MHLYKKRELIMKITLCTIAAVVLILSILAGTNLTAQLFLIIGATLFTGVYVAHTMQQEQRKKKIRAHQRQAQRILDGYYR